MLQVRKKLMRPQAEDTRDLLDTDPATWSSTQADMKDVRDLKEVQFLTKLLAEINADRLAEAVDLLVMRVREIRMAKMTGGSWEKANAVSLMPSTATVSTPLPDGSMAL